MGWWAPAKVQADYAGRSGQGPDLSTKLPSREILVAIRELDERGRPGRAFITQTDYLTRRERTTVNKSFTASGKLEVTVTRGWEQHPVLSQRDTGKSTLEHRLPGLTPLTACGTCRSSRPSSLIRIWRRGQRRSCRPNSAADMLVCDTGVLLAAGNVKDHHHVARASH